MQRTVQFLPRFQQRIGTGRTVPAVDLKSPGIDDQLARHPFADRIMGMAVDNAIRFRKDIPEPGFDIVGMPAQIVAMQEADCKITDLKTALSGQSASTCSAATVAVNRMHGFIGKNIQYGYIGQVSGMDDQLAVGKTLPDSINILSARMP